MRISFFPILALSMVACAGRAPAPDEGANQRKFAELLKKNDIKNAALFSLYFHEEKPTDGEAALLAQYQLQACNPAEALEIIEGMKDQPLSRKLKAVSLALVSIERPWTKPILKARAVGSQKNTEKLEKEVWADEWKAAEVNIEECDEFPVLATEEERRDARQQARALFNQEAELIDSLPILGLALDVGYRPSVAEARQWLKKFSREKENPYYAQLEEIAVVEDRMPSALKALGQRGSKVKLGAFSVRKEEWDPHEMEIPWALGALW